MLVVSIEKIQSEDVNKNLPLYCEYPNGDVTYMYCQSTGINTYTVLKQLQELKEQERLRVTHFKLYKVDMLAMRTKALAMFPNLKKLELNLAGSHSCVSDALQGLPKLEHLYFNPGLGGAYHLDGLFDNLNLNYVKFGELFNGVKDLTLIFNSLRKYKLEYFETKSWRMPWANLTEWFQGEYMKTLILNSLNKLFETYANPIDDKDYFREFTNLETLSLPSNRITNIVNGAFRFCKKLKSINLSRNWLRQITPGMFEGLDALMTLDLSRNIFRHLIFHVTFSQLLRWRILGMRGAVNDC
jgi:hypothetical protein